MKTRLDPVLVTPPESDVLALADVKAHLRVDHDDDDDLIGGLISAALAYVEGWRGVTGRALISQTWSESLPYFSHKLPLRLGPVQSITSVTYFDLNEVSQTVPTGVYRLHSAAGRGYLVQRDGQSWPSAFSRDDAVTVTYVAGYGADADAVPADLLQGMRLLIAHWYENREAVVTGTIATSMPIAADAILGRYRRTGLPA